MVSEVPQTVINQIKRQIATLEVLTIARQTDASFNGQGRYEAEAYLNRRDEIETAWKRIDEFEAQCNKHSVDPATVYAGIGQPSRLSDAAKEWVADFSRGGSIEGKTVIYDGRGVYPAASFIGVLRDDDPQKLRSPSCAHRYIVMSMRLAYAGSDEVCRWLAFSPLHASHNQAKTKLEAARAQYGSPQAVDAPAGVSGEWESGQGRESLF